MPGPSAEEADVRVSQAPLPRACVEKTVVAGRGKRLLLVPPSKALKATGLQKTLASVAERTPAAPSGEACDARLASFAKNEPGVGWAQ